jgi:hypothetical protein
MASILGSCGCGCGGGCEPVTSNCNFVLRKYDNNTRADVSWTSEATQQEIDCYNSTYGCPGVSFEYRFSVCTGEGEIYRAGGGSGGGGAGCYLVTDFGTSVYSIPCASTDLSTVLLYSYYDEGSGSGTPLDGNITYNGVEYTVSAGVPALAGPPPDPNDPNNAQQSASTASASISAMSSGILLGTFTSSYTDEYIDFDQIGEVELNEFEKNQPGSPCKFSYNFSFTPEDGVDYYIITLPCDETKGYPTVTLAQDGRAYFLAKYDETTKTCNIVESYVTTTE